MPSIWLTISPETQEASMSTLHLAPGLSIPLEAATQTFAILAKRGSERTYTALVMVEEMLKAGLQTVVVDPVGVCWGLEPLLMERMRVTDSCAGRTTAI